VNELPDLQVEFATEPNGPDGTTFLPYLRDPQTLARPWAVPGTPGLEHRIGGLEKADKTGDISYDPANHDLMVRTRAARIEGIEVPDLEVEDPDGTATVLVLGWGSTYGPIGAACRVLRQRGLPIAQAHLRHLSPLPANLGEVLKAYEKVVVPEMNLGQLAQLIRGKYLVDAIPFNQISGLPFTAATLETMLEDVVKNG
jgi:2-oxoglutarate ferredoxin oxidoreductase subunit alpha